LSSRRRSLGSFEISVASNAKHVLANRERVGQRLDAGREGLPFVMTEIGVSGTRRDHQEVVRRALLADQHQPLRRIDPRHRLHEHGGIGLPAENRTDWSRDRVGRQSGGGHLIEQWLKQVIVVSIDQRDMNGRACECACRR